MDRFYIYAKHPAEILAIIKHYLWQTMETKWKCSRFLCCSKVQTRFSLLDKTELWCLHSRVCQAFFHRASMKQLLTSGWFQKPSGLERLHVRASVEGERGEKSPILLSRSLSASVSSLLLRTDRSFDSGSKFTSQTCWEAGERSDGKPFCTSRTPSFCWIACQKY